MTRPLYWLTLIIAGLLLSACASTPSYTKAQPHLQVADAGHFDVVLRQPDSPLPRFQRMYIEPAEVTFNRSWLTQYRGQYHQRDLERIERDYGELLVNALARELTSNTHLTRVDSPEQADLILKPHLLHLNIYAPDLMQPGLRSYYAREIGNATLDLHLIEASSGTVVAQFVDHRETSAGLMMRGERANRVTNARYFRRMMERWSSDLADYLIDTGAACAEQPC